MVERLDALKQDAPKVYWLAVDMAANGRNLNEIAKAITEELKFENEYRALTGKRELTLDFGY